MNRALASAFGLLLLGVGLGAVLRAAQVLPLGFLPLQHAVHAHSHTLYFGWAGLALFALFFERVGATGAGAKVVLAALGAQGLATFFVFGRFGYGRPGVVLSALTVVPFVAAVVLFLRAARRARGVDLPFLQAAVVHVVVAYAAALARVVLKVRGHDAPLVGAACVHLFLGAFMAFFLLGVMGLTVRALVPGSAPRSLALVLGVAAPLLPWPALLTLPGLEGTWLGALARVAAWGLLLPAALWLAWVWRASADAPGRGLWRSAALAFAASALAGAAVASGALGGWALQRHAVIFGVHLQTLGVVTASLLLLVERRHPRPRVAALWLHQGALAVMLLGLLGLARWPGPGWLWLVAVSGAAVVGAQAWCAARFLLGARAATAAAGLPGARMEAA